MTSSGCWALGKHFTCYLHSWLQVEFFCGMIHSQCCSNRTNQSKSAVARRVVSTALKYLLFKRLKKHNDVNLTCIYTSMFGRSPSTDFHPGFSVSPLYYSEKIRCICSVHDLVFWYADAQPRLSPGISVATALTNAVTMYSLLSENQIRLKLGLGPKSKILQSIYLLCQHSAPFVCTAGRGSGKCTLASRDGFLSHGGCGDGCR